jgi:hypothetical protein
MRRMLWISAAVALVFPAAAVCAQEQQQSQSQQSQSQQSQAQTQSDSQKTQQSSADKPQSQNSQGQAGSQSAQPQDSLAAAAKKAREQKKESAKPAKVFTNDDMPAGGISTVGADKSADSSASSAGGAQDASAAAGPNDEKTWRARFEKLHHKLDQDQQELDVLQRELGVAATQFYGGDPNKAMNDQMSGQPYGADYTKKLGEIDAKKKKVEADKQAISDAEEELRKAGGDPGWAR